MSAGTIFRTILRGIERESPTILTGFGIAGFGATIVLAVRATPKALYLIGEEKSARYADESRREPLTKLDIIKLTWKCYVPSAMVGLTSVACFIGAHSINLRRNAALAGLYSLTEASLRTYQEKVIETIGESKERKVRDAIAQDQIDENPVSKNQIFVTGKGKTLFYDSWSGRYFESDMESVKKAQNDLNHKLLGGDMYLPLNFLYSELGLAPIKGGEDIGWTFDGGMLEVLFTSKIADNDVPCIVMNYKVGPEFFRKINESKFETFSH